MTVTEAPETALFAGPSAESEAALLKRLDALVADGRIGLVLDRAKLSHIDFPMALEADGNLWAYPLVLATVLIGWFLGIWAGIAAALASALCYRTLGRAYIARRLDARIRENGLKSVESWRRLWRFGGVVLTGPDGTPCRGPEGNWMALVRAADPA